MCLPWVRASGQKVENVVNINELPDSRTTSSRIFTHNARRTVSAMLEGLTKGRKGAKHGESEHYTHLGSGDLVHQADSALVSVI